MKHAIRNLVENDPPLYSITSEAYRDQWEALRATHGGEADIGTDGSSNMDFPPVTMGWEARKKLCEVWGGASVDDPDDSDESLYYNLRAPFLLYAGNRPGGVSGDDLYLYGAPTLEDGGIPCDIFILTGTGKPRQGRGSLIPLLAGASYVHLLSGGEYSLSGAVDDLPDLDKDEIQEFLYQSGFCTNVVLEDGTLDIDQRATDIATRFSSESGKFWGIGTNKPLMF